MTPIEEVKPPAGAESGTNGNGAAEPRVNPQPPRVTPTRHTLHGPLEDFFSMLALPFTLAGDYYCAYIVSTRTPAFAHSLANLAERNPALKRALKKMMEGGDIGQCVYTGLAIVIPIAFHHGGEQLGFHNPFELNPMERADYEAYLREMGVDIPSPQGADEPQGPEIVPAGGNGATSA